MAGIVLRDIHELIHVQADTEVFCPPIPVYFRVDLLKAIINYEVLFCYRQVKYYAVYADLDMQSLNEEELFDEETVYNLKTYGIVLADGGHWGFENGFQILSRQNTNFTHALLNMLIKLNIVRAQHALKGQFNNVSGRKPHGSMQPLEQVVYDSYPSMFYYFYSLEGLGTLKMRNGNIYDVSRDGYRPFGEHQILFVFDFITDDTRFDNFRNLWVPTKKVPLPQAKKNYY